MFTVYKCHYVSVTCYREVPDTDCREAVPGDTQKLWTWPWLRHLSVSAQPGGWARCPPEVPLFL